jgi:uncharacterized repeat protein (TIGR02543 family)
MKKQLKIKRGVFQILAPTSLAIFALTFGAWLNFGSPSRDDVASAAQFGDQYTGLTVDREALNHNIEYSYLKSGESLTVVSTYQPTGSNTASTTDNYRTIIYAPDGSIAKQCTLDDGLVLADSGTSCTAQTTAASAGIYKIVTYNDSFDKGNGMTMNYDITVRDSTNTEITGRTWTNRLDMYQNPGWTTDADYPKSSNFDLYGVNDAGYIYHVNINKFYGMGSTIYLDAAGAVLPQDSCDSSYYSGNLNTQQGVDLVAAGEPRVYTSGSQCAKYRLFYEEPNADLPVSAPSADGILSVLPVAAHSASTPIANLTPVLDVTNLISGLTFSENPTSRNKSGTLNFSLSLAFTGNYTVQVDTNNNGSFDDPVDLAFDKGAAGGSANNNIVVDFNGKNGQGADISPNQTIKFRIKFDRLAEIHLLLSDVEYLGGVTMTRLNGSDPGDSTIYWDDTKLITAADSPSCTMDNGAVVPCVNGETPILDGTDGVDSNVDGGVHGWTDLLHYTNATTGNPAVIAAYTWGDTRLIDNWTYIPTDNYSDLTATGRALWTVEFESNGGNDVPLQKIVPNNPADEPNDPTRDGFTFCGWYGDADLTTVYDFGTLVNENKVLWACWKENPVPVEVPGEDIVVPDTGYWNFGG